MKSMQKPFWTTTALALVASGALLSGCEQKTTRDDMPIGSATTTTTVPNAAATRMSRAGDAVSDAALTTKVKSALLADPNVKGLRIDVDTHEGTVTLNGSADSAANMERAATVARSVSGVKSVDNRLSVKATG
ncbi:MAG: BON domain-containing protein [Caldimonas sp.]